MAKIIRIIPQMEVAPQADDVRLFQIRLDNEKIRNEFNHRPGQFVMISVLGTGEAPISISSSPTRPGIIELCIRKAGKVTNALFRLKENATIGIRGPYGNGYFMERIKGNNLLIIAGGIGMAPLRSLLWYSLDNRDDFKDIILMYGTKTPKEMLFKDELFSLLDRKDIKCLLTVDKDDTGTWKANIGVVTRLFDMAGLGEEEAGTKAQRHKGTEEAGDRGQEAEGVEIQSKSNLSIDRNGSSVTTYAAICGPPIMYQFVLQKLIECGFSKDKIMMSLERRMQCGIGKCLHCSVGHKYTCTDGPIFTYWDVMNMQEVV
ncbi:FAD/NAD(P)-binding protein [Candidatus Desantisbacteria bacterium]|nr:FAD/NAD(P)-binding protein [Candidatus Desantisbacteria bacterium]